jgi:hypothetical protein
MGQADDRLRRQLPLFLGRETIPLPVGPNRAVIVELLAQLLVAALEADPPVPSSEEAADEDA